MCHCGYSLRPNRANALRGCTRFSGMGCGWLRFRAKKNARGGEAGGRLWKQMGSARLLGEFDLGSGEDVLAVHVLGGAGGGDLRGAAAEVLVECLGDVVAFEQVEDRLVAIFDRDGVLAAAGLLEGALGAAAFAGDGLVCGRGGQGGGNEQGQSAGEREDLFHVEEWWLCRHRSRSRAMIHGLNLSYGSLRKSYPRGRISQGVRCVGAVSRSILGWLGGGLGRIGWRRPGVVFR